jgi:hypothetical protein
MMDKNTKITIMPLAFLLFSIFPRLLPGHCLPHGSRAPMVTYSHHACRSPWRPQALAVTSVVVSHAPSLRAKQVKSSIHPYWVPHVSGEVEISYFQLHPTPSLCKSTKKRSFTVLNTPAWQSMAHNS